MAQSLLAYYYTANSGSQDLSADISAKFYTQNLSAYYYTANSGSQGLNAELSVMFSGSSSLSGTIDPQAEAYLGGFYRPLVSGSECLYSFIEPIPPVDLMAELTGVVGVSLSGTVESVPPKELGATISGLSVLSLGASIAGFEALDLGAAWAHTNQAPDLSATLSGFGTTSGILPASYSGYHGVEESQHLRAILLFREELDIDASIEGFRPSTLSGSLEAISPLSLFAEINGKAVGEVLGAVVTGTLADGSLLAEIVATGGLDPLTGYIRAATAGILDLSAALDGIIYQELKAEYGTTPQDLLFAQLTATGINNQGLSAQLVPNVFTTLSGSYTVHPSQALLGSITSIPAEELVATIIPRVFYVDSSIPINTFPFKELRAVINATGCAFSSFYDTLGVYIKGVSADDLTASITGIAGQYAVTEDFISILRRNNVISEDWIFLIADQSVLTESILPLIITSAPYADLGAKITGTPTFTDLNAAVDPLFYSGVRSDGSVLGEWVNVHTGERKTIKIFFHGDSLEYYFSEDADTSFSLSPESTLEIIVETYEKLDETTSTLLTQKQDTKRCIVDKLDEFPSIDAAVRFAIMCALSEISSDLRASITAKGGNSVLGANIDPIDTKFLTDLPAKYTPTTNAPDLAASITAAGGHGGLVGYIVPTNPGETFSLISDTMGQKYVPKLVTHGTGQVSVVLTKVLSTDSIELAFTPDLRAKIAGVAYEVLGATISGTL